MTTNTLKAEASDGLVEFLLALADDEGSEGNLENARKLREAAGYLEGQPDDLRAKGWTVAVHNDYRLNGEAHTFWLMTKDGRAVKGEGRSDAEALNSIRASLAAAPSGGAQA